MIRAKLFIEISLLFLWTVRHQPHQGAHYSGARARTPHRIRNERIMPKTDNKTKKKAPRNEPQRP
jgi:hypothetical protein